MPIGSKLTRLQIIYATKSATIGKMTVHGFRIKIKVLGRNITIIIAEIQTMIQMVRGVILQIIVLNMIIV